METMETTLIIMVFYGIGQGLTWLLLGRQIRDLRRWRAEVLDGRLAETASLLSRLCEHEREIAATAEWLRRHEQAVVAAARGAREPAGVERRANGNGIGDGTGAVAGDGEGRPVTEPASAEAPKRWVGRCIRCAAPIQAERVQPYCAMCFRAWVRDGRPERPEPYCGRCGRRTGATTFRRMRCDACAAPKRPAAADAAELRPVGASTAEAEGVRG